MCIRDSIDTEAFGFNSPITDDATVICSSFESNCCWAFSIVWQTQTGSQNNGSHPVSGNRQFGIEELSDGSFEFYIRAADRARINWIVKGLATISGNNATELFYEITDQSWDNLMSNIEALVNNPDFGGSGSKNEPEIIRPDWDEVKVLLMSNTPLTTLPCK